MSRKTIWAASAVAVLLMLYILRVPIYRILSSDEAPIRVRNGSLEIEAAAGREWQPKPKDNDEETANYSHEPTGGIHLDPFDKDLWVKVTPASSSCTNNDPTTSGRVVTIEYDADGAGADFTATLKRAKNGPVNYRTKIRPANGLALDSTGTKLTYPVAGHISKIKIGQWECTFTTANPADRIDICSSERRQDCQ
jgi:hypothetical protein